MSRRAFRTEDLGKKEENYDELLSQSIARFKARLPEDYDRITHYIRSLALPIKCNAELTEVVNAEYHRKSMALEIAYRLQSLDELN